MYVFNFYLKSCVIAEDDDDGGVEEVKSFQVKLLNNLSM